MVTSVLEPEMIIFRKEVGAGEQREAGPNKALSFRPDLSIKPGMPPDIPLFEASFLPDYIICF